MSLENAVDTFKKLAAEPVKHQFSSFEHMSDGSVRAVIVLHTGPCQERSYERIQDNQGLDKEAFSHVDSETTDETFHRDRISYNMDIETWREEIAYDLVDALFLTLALTSRTPRHSLDSPNVAG